MPMDRKTGLNFRNALWAGLAAPIGLYAAPTSYPYFVSTFSVPQSFAQVGAYMNYGFGRIADEVRPVGADRG
jgi:hypothetical protein